MRVRWGRTVAAEIEEEEQVDCETAEEIYNEERENWLDYSAQPYSKEYEKEVSGHHYDNPFKERTDDQPN